MTYTIAALYRFTPIAEPAVLRDALLAEFTKLNICGTLLVAAEGINGTLAGTAEDVQKMLALLTHTCGLERDDYKFSSAEFKPFQRLKVRVKKELITFKQASADPTKQVGQYLNPTEWNALVENPDVIVLDTRNLYETEIGTFDKAVVPPIHKFTEFADFVRTQMAEDKNKKIAMFCTGGIRCEKASAFMLAEGFPEVYHLKGGILKYLEETAPEQSKWRGSCYVFDERVAVGHGLEVETPES